MITHENPSATKRCLNYEFRCSTSKITKDNRHLEQGHSTTVLSLLVMEGTVGIPVNHLSNNFSIACELPDTFQSWFIVLHLHIW